MAIKVNAANKIDQAKLVQPVDLNAFMDVVEEYAAQSGFDVRVSLDDIRLSSGGKFARSQKTQPGIIIKRSGYPDLILLQELQGRMGYLNVFVPPSWAERFSNAFSAMVEDRKLRKGRGIINTLLENKAEGDQARLAMLTGQYIEAFSEQVLVPALQDGRSFDRGDRHIKDFENGEGAISVNGKGAGTSPPGRKQIVPPVEDRPEHTPPVRPAPDNERPPVIRPNIRPDTGGRKQPDLTPPVPPAPPEPTPPAPPAQPRSISHVTPKPKKVFIPDVHKLGFVTAEGLKNGCQIQIVTKNKNVITVDVPAGSKAGQVITVKGRGRKNPETGEKGDLLVELFLSE